MKKIQFTNRTKYELCIEYSSNVYIIGSNQVLEIFAEYGDTVRVNKNCDSGRYFFASYTIKDTPNIVKLGPVRYTNFVAQYKIKPGIKKITITECNYSFYLKNVFSLLLFNETMADSYDFSTPKDKREFNRIGKMQFFIMQCFAYFMSFVVIFSVFTMFAEFKWALLLIALMCFGIFAFVRNYRKKLKNAVDINNHLAEVLDMSTSVTLFQRKSWFLECYEIE